MGAVPGVQRAPLMQSDRRFLWQLETRFSADEAARGRTWLGPRVKLSCEPIVFDLRKGRSASSELAPPLTPDAAPTRCGAPSRSAMKSTSR